MNPLANWFGPDRRQARDLGLPRDTTPATARAALAADTDDLTVLQRLATDPDPSVRRATYANTHLPADIVAHLARRGDVDLHPALAAHPALDLATAGYLAAADPSRVTAEALLAQVPTSDSGSGWEPVCDTLAQAHPDLSVAAARALIAHVPDIHSLSEHPSRDVHLLLATHPDASPALLDRYAHSDDADLVFLACGHPSRTGADLAGYAVDERLQPRLAAAAHPNTAADTLADVLAHTSQPDAVRAVAASNPHTPPAVLAGLAANYPEQVAANPSCPAATLHDLAGLGEVTVQRAVAGNPSCSAGMLRLLIGSSDAQTRDNAAATLRTQQEPVGLQQ